MRINRSVRLKAYFLLTLFCGSTFFPQISWALTGGPSQPEVESFEPVTTNQMVDAFTGDFTYNIPLMTVPGPNGGYPINIAYHAGVGMEQEASWVGLGWNINPGVINRNLRGLPDDFSGERITKKQNIRTNRTVGFSKGSKQNIDFEIFGAEFDIALSSSKVLNVNNYRGIGFDRSYGFNFSMALKTSDRADETGITEDQPDDFVGPPALVGQKIEAKNRITRFSVGNTVSSKQGIGDFAFGISNQIAKRSINTVTGKDKSSGFAKAGGMSFGTIPPIPGRHIPFNTANFKADLLFGSTIFGVANENTTVGGYYSKQKLDNNNQEIYSEAYGYLNSELADRESNAVMDLMLEKDVTLSKHVPSISIPVSTYDIFSISGQGISGMFRAYRSSIVTYREESTDCHSETYELGSELEIDGGTQLGLNPIVGYGQSNTGPIRNGSGNEISQYKGTKQRNGLFEPFYFKLVGEYSSDKDSFYDWNFEDTPVALDMHMQGENGRVRPQVRNDVIGQGGEFISQRTSRKSRNQLINYYTVFEAENAMVQESFLAAGDGTEPVNGDTSFTSMDYDNIWSLNHTENQIAKMQVIQSDGSTYTYGLAAPNEIQKDVVFAINDESSFLLDPYDPDFPESGSGSNIYHEDEYYSNPPFTGYDYADASTGNETGSDHFFSSTELPTYAHSYMLTKIESADYVDLTNNGPSKDDLGDYVKFNYSEITDVYWRAPFQGANYDKGNFQDRNDDKGSYSWGKKRVYYLHSIETKTHVAFFETEIRSDAWSATDVENKNSIVGEITSTGRRPSFKLTRIELRTNDEVSELLQAVEFRYDYALCPNVPNYLTPSVEEKFLVDEPGLNGKLTLREIIFEHGQNKKARQTPYRFEYFNDDGASAHYDLRNVDRWGNYCDGTSIPQNENYSLNENPYVSQYGSHFNSEQRVENVSAWNLQEITMPSGSKISIEYESDDYAYVQDKSAMQMMRILGTSNVDETEIDDSNNFFNLNKNRLRVYFALEDDDDNEENSDYENMNEVEEDIVVRKYLSDVNGQFINDLYFKIWTCLKDIPGGGIGVENWAKEYVNGYGKIEQTDDSFGITEGVNPVGYFTLQKSNCTVIAGAHPFKFAGWQYIRNERPDLMNLETFDDNSPISVSTIVSILASRLVSPDLKLLSSLLGYYTNAAAKGWCYMESDRPSFVRLHSPDGVKFGGGHRVKRLTVKNNWAELNNDDEYSTRYYYRTIQGHSSGVAANEPVIGGEESPLRVPIWYNGSQNQLNFIPKESFVQAPYCESFLPAPTVGYSRVVTRAEAQYGTADRSTSASTVQEYYTSKDFPVYIHTPTPLEKSKLNITIPLLVIGGSIDIHNSGYSQGFSIVLNDMHGKPKSQKVYKNYVQLIPDSSSNFPFVVNEETLPEPVSMVKYDYFTEEENESVLKNDLPVLLDDNGNTEVRWLGMDYDFYMAEREFATWDGSVGGDFNITFPTNITPTPSFSAFPQASYGESFFRSVATTKVIFKTGILKKVTNVIDGSYSYAENLLFDPVTGEALLVKSQNEHDDPIYTLKIPAYWNYEGMGPAYQNIRALLRGGDPHDLISLQYGILTNVNGSYDFRDYFFEGDMVKLCTVDEYGNVDNNIEYYWANEVSETEVHFIDEDGLDAADHLSQIGYANTSWFIEVLKSGRKNLQSLPAGSIVTLSYPFNDVYSDMASALTEWLDGLSVCPPDSLEFSFQTCIGEVVMPVDITCSGGSVTLDFELPSGSSGESFTWTIPYSATLGKIVLTGSSVQNNSSSGNGELQIIQNSTGEQVGSSSSEFTLPYDMVNCLEDVLQAAAIEYADRSSSGEGWNYNFAEWENSVGANTEPLGEQDNLYRYGRKGIWRPIRNFVYQVDRDQSSHNASEGLGTNTSRDGLFNSFVKFDWQANDVVADNAEWGWDWASKTTLFDPLGSVLEQEDALGIFSAELKGYQQRLVVANAGNARYHEIAYDGFEDHGNGFGVFGHLDQVDSPVLDTIISHTGKKSRIFGTGNSYIFEVGFPGAYIDDGTFKAQTEQEEYLLSCWIYSPGGTDLSVRVCVDHCGSFVDYPLEDFGDPIDGWHKVDIKTTFPDADNSVSIINNTGQSVYLDDLRIHPANSAMNTYVYDPVTYRLVAILDDNNYATFYNYDEEGTLIQTKRETERGIVTVSTNRQSIKHN